MPDAVSSPSINQNKQIALFEYEYHWNGNPKLEAEGFSPSMRRQQLIEYAVRRLCSLELQKSTNDYLINLVFVVAFLCPDLSGQELVDEVKLRIKRMHEWHASHDHIPSK